MIFWAMAFCLLFGWLAGHSEGWKKAHLNVARECKALGGFYVGDEVFKCIKIEPAEDETWPMHLQQRPAPPPKPPAKKPTARKVPPTE